MPWWIGLITFALVALLLQLVEPPRTAGEFGNSLVLSAVFGALVGGLSSFYL
jgi:hypothetical protein